MNYNTNSVNISPPPPNRYRPVLMALIGTVVLLLGTALVYIFFFREPGSPLLPIGGGVLPGTDDKTPPSSPTGVTALSSAANITLSWNPSTDNIGVTGYYIYRDNTRLGTVTTPRFTDSMIKAETLYTYTISAYDEAGNESVRSDVFSVRATDTFESPTNPTLSVRGASGEHITVKNFYTASKEILVFGDAIIQETEYYKFLFIRLDESFLIILKDKNVHVARAIAESDMLEILDISEADACKLALIVGVSPEIPEIGEQYNQVYGLSFCPGAKGF